MEFPDPPYSPVPVNRFQYPSVEDLEEHVRERGTGDRNLMRMWLPDQIWTQNRVERARYGYAQEWPEWAMSFIDNTHRPDGSTMTGGRAFQGGVLLANENRRYMLAMQRRLDARYFLQFVYLC